MSEASKETTIKKQCSNFLTGLKNFQGLFLSRMKEIGLGNRHPKDRRPKNRGHRQQPRTGRKSRLMMKRCLFFSSILCCRLFLVSPMFEIVCLQILSTLALAHERQMPKSKRSSSARNNASQFFGLENWKRRSIIKVAKLLHLNNQPHCEKISICIQKFNFQQKDKIMNLNFRAEN